MNMAQFPSEAPIFDTGEGILLVVIGGGILFVLVLVIGSMRKTR